MYDWIIYQVDAEPVPAPFQKLEQFPSGNSQPPARARQFQYQAFATSPLPFVSFGWMEQLSEPVRLKPRLGAGLNPDLFFNPNPPIVSFGWFETLSEPVRYRWFHTANQRELFYDPFPLGTNIFPDAYYIAWSDPVRTKPALLTGLQQPLFHVVSPITLYLQATESPDVMAFTIETFAELTGAEVAIVEIFPIYANASSAYVNRIYCDVGVVEISS